MSVSTTKSLWDDLIIVQLEREFLVFSPSRRAGFLANKSATEILKALESGADLSTLPVARTLITQVSDLLAEEPQFIPEPKSSTASVSFQPTSAILLPTSACSLRCVYCFSSAGQTTSTMPWDLAQAAVDFVIKNAQRVGAKCKLLFLGGGEPTLAWDLLVKTTDYGRKRARRSGVSLSVDLVTNGVFSDKRCDWIADNIDGIQVSFDGDMEIQDLQRATRGGGSSFGAVYNTCVRLRDKGSRFVIRTTVTQYSVERLAEITEFFLALKPRAIQLEPLTEAGRAKKNRWSSPSPDLFVRNFKQAFLLGKENGVDVLTSGTRLNRCSTRACGAAGSIFCVTPGGWITACHRVSSPEDPASKYFFFGRFDRRTGSFKFQKSRLAALSDLSVVNSLPCGECIARWHCSGGCYQENYVSSNVLSLREKIQHCDIRKGLSSFLVGLQFDGKRSDDV